MINQLANIISSLRIVGVGLIFWMTPYTTNLTQIVVILFYTVICLTDFLDGWISRKLKIESDIGKILDTVADKILVLLFLPLLEMQVITSFP
ncbi:MAG: CDP-alcohol phosphatidyltransferase family protein, partial [Candidatus Margulisbacteria bacterium]|nr:CDP-alcohol phosphatidyltransferase family protein [Candidatus Margulisiibacteriota bacterium]